MNHSEEYWALSDIAYQEMVKQMEADSVAAKKRFLAIQIPPNYFDDDLPEKIKIEKKSLVGLNILKCYKSLIFFPDDEILNKFKLFGYKNHIVSWLIPLSVLNDQFSRICASGIKIDRHKAIQIIQTHLGAKFFRDILMHIETHNHDNVHITAATHVLNKLNNRRKYSGSDPKSFKSELEKKVNQLINHATNNKLSEKQIINLSKGKTDELHIRILISEYFQYDTKAMSESKFFCSIYDLFALIMPDRNFITEDDYFKNKKRIYQSYASFDKKKAKTVRAILKPPRKKISSV